MGGGGLGEQNEQGRGVLHWYSRRARPQGAQVWKEAGESTHEEPGRTSSCMLLAFGCLNGRGSNSRFLSCWEQSDAEGEWEEGLVGGEEKGDEVPGGILDTWVPMQVGRGDAFFRWPLCETGSKTSFWE